jgi:hypothetical protein
MEGKAGTGEYWVNLKHIKFRMSFELTLAQSRFRNEPLDSPV